MRCEEIMKSNVVFAREDESIQSIAQRMESGNLGFVPVVDAEGRATGTLTDRDLTVRVAADDRDPSSTRAREVMSHEVISCNGDDDVEVARRLFEDNEVSRLVVATNDGKLCGVISLSDVIAHVGDKLGGEVLHSVAAREAHP